MAVPPQPAYAFDVGEVYGLAPTVAASPPTDHSPDLGRIAMSHTNGRAGWWKSPGPDLGRGRGGQPPGLRVTCPPTAHVSQAAAWPSGGGETGPAVGVYALGGKTRSAPGASAWHNR